MHHKHTHMLLSDMLATDRFTNDATCLPSHAHTLSKKTWTPMQRPRRAWARALAKALSAMFHPIQISSRSMSCTHDAPLGGRSPPKAPNPNPKPNCKDTLTPDLC